MRSDEAIMYSEAGSDPGAGTFVTEFGDSRTTFVPVPSGAVAAEVAKELTDNGVQRIELCGALGPAAAAEVLRAIDRRIPVGVCTFGIESIDGAARFDTKLKQGNTMTVALLFLAGGSDPVDDRVVTESGIVRMLFVPVPDESELARIADDLVRRDHVDLVELYRGIGQEGTATVLEAMDATVPVGSVRYER